MKNHIISIALVLFGITACTQQSAPEFANHQGQRISIEAQATPGIFDALFVLKFNGQVVIEQRTQPFGGSSQSFEGTWNGRQVRARATAVQKLLSNYTLVDVFIDGQLVETLSI